MSTDPSTLPWQMEIDTVIELMRNLSMQTDPQAAAKMYGEGLRRLKIVPHVDRTLSLSRRGLEYPRYRITRSSTWKDPPNPWREPEKLPLLSGGLLAELLYSDQLAILPDLQSRLSPGDPAHGYLHDMNLLFHSPQFDNGRSINANAILMKEAADFPYERVPMIVFQANLWGRATLNLVTQQKLQAAYDAMARELQVVANIQRSLLPRALPPLGNARIAAHYQTSQLAGGDYYDFFPLPNDQWGVFVGDVSGHGTPAAVLMAITHAIAHTHPGDPMPPEQVLTFLNQKLTRLYTNGNGTFVTAFYGIFDPDRRKLTYASAGHPPPRLVRQCDIQGVDGETSLPLGIDADERFLCHTLDLKGGDDVLLYTDGVPDTFNGDGVAFGTDRLDDACCAAAQVVRKGTEGNPAEAFLGSILGDLTNFAGGMQGTDDRTMVAMVVS